MPVPWLGAMPTNQFRQPPMNHVIRHFAGLMLLMSASLAGASIRDFEVLRDELPDSLPLEQIEVVVLSNPDACEPRLVKRFGLTIDVSGATSQERMVCREALPGLMGTTPEGLRLRHVQLAKGTGSVADDLARVAPGEPLRRYVALLRWQVWPAPYHIGMRLEEVLYDRDTQRWLWHAIRLEQSWMLSRDSAKEHLKDATDVLRSVLHLDLPHALARRASHRQGDMPTGARWLTPAELASWQPGREATLMLVNQDHRESTHITAPFDKLVLRPADAPDVSQTVLVPGSRRHLQYAQSSPPIQRLSYAVLAVPPGDYLARYGTKAPFALKLNAGDVVVYTTLAQLMRIGDTRTERSLDWFKQNRPLLRHAFLADELTAGGGEADRVHYRVP
jgi:hypothetical protein